MVRCLPDHRRRRSLVVGTTSTASSTAPARPQSSTNLAFWSADPFDIESVSLGGATEVLAELALRMRFTVDFDFDPVDQLPPSPASRPRGPRRTLRGSDPTFVYGLPRRWLPPDRHDRDQARVDLSGQIDLLSAGVKVDGARLLRLVGDPRRWAILSALAAGDRRVGELVEVVGERQNLVSYHLRELRDAGLVSSRRSSFDARDAYYRVDLGRCRSLLRDAAASLHPALLPLGEVPLPSPPRRLKPRVLFLCTGNSARSQMAAALLEHRSGGAIGARSAGSHPKALHPLAVQVLAARGIDISANDTCHLRRYARTHFDFVVTLCDKVREVCPDFPGDPAYSHWSTADPAAAPAEGDGLVAAFERTAVELEERVDLLIAQMSAPRGGSHHA